MPPVCFTCHLIQRRTGKTAPSNNCISDNLTGWSTERDSIMGFLKEINKMARAATSQQRKIEAQQRKNERAVQMIITSVESMIRVANGSLRMAADKSRKLPTRISRLDIAKKRVAEVKQLVSQHSFLKLPNLHVFENDIVRIGNELRQDQQLAIEQKKRKPSPTKTKRAGKKSMQSKTRVTKATVQKLQHTFQDARMEMYQANADVLDGVQWLAALDHRTCLFCGALDGKIWHPNQLRQIKKPPLHKACRCRLVPYIDIGDGAGRSGAVENFDQIAKEKYETNPNIKKKYDDLSYEYRRKLRYDAIKEYGDSGKAPYVQMKNNATIEDIYFGALHLEKKRQYHPELLELIGSTMDYINFDDSAWDCENTVLDVMDGKTAEFFFPYAASIGFTRQ